VWTCWRSGESGLAAGEKGGEVITKAQIATQNAAMEQLSRRMLDEQKEKRMDYAAQRSSMQEKSAPAAAAPATAEGCATCARRTPPPP